MSRPTSRASTLHSDEHTDGPSFAFETPTPAQRPGSRFGSVSLASGELRSVSDDQKRALAPSLRSRRTGQAIIGQFNSSPTSDVASTIAISEVVPTPVLPVANRQKITIRSDPALYTTFDPKDKELFDLWVPKA